MNRNKMGITNWQKYALGEILKVVSRPVTIEIDRSYRILGMRWYAQGLFEKETLFGHEIKANKLFRVEEGDLVYNRLFAWKGSFGLVDANTAGAFVSGEFPCFRVNSEIAEPRFLVWFLSRESLWKDIERKSVGQTNISRLRLKVPVFLSFRIPLPPLDEQRWIARRLDAISARVEQAQWLRDETSNKFERLLIQMAHRDDLSREQKLSRGWKEIDLNEVIRQTKDRHLVTPEESYPNLGIYSFGRGLFKKPPIDGAVTSARDLYRVKTGQFIYSRLFAFEGAYGVVTDEYDGYYVSGEFPTFECDQQQVTPEFLFAYFKSPRIWKTLLSGSKGLGNRRQRIQPKILLAHRLLLPPMEVQEQLVAMFRKAEAFIGISSETQQKFSVFMPAVLERAFNGEL